ncbi:MULTISPECIES: hydantoinase/oxoprolinase family protein [unclassified Microbacterium]|uniref:hydantoinase/oxoprolinase family protein n=2 Tax=Microbacterium TaxID=33882 RepID=UPI0006F7CDC6|nr:MULTISPECIES: hydantoinase/oxoprolinase family protein [unclassified Microbacterium]KQR84783.1 hydantoinase subunit beta [Microbacterium sp. Leaf179]KQT75673.1 hydantoinase subunit beta [Microbacterium sp. Leaf436]MBD8205976.1 hydantoinase/oxoprolinase family protein [Microbacterium sp. CFBP 8801]MBD8217873.1 hydantoinase/oxoprolinase family protein [Microbacterium sp. CFBP 13617]MBD8476592.1 hydantoinase/oxoprolinase family protein [Microbacterium sp. CFBP 8794]
MIAVRDLSIGVDVGGTNTDAVVVDATGSVIAWTKQPTTADVIGGIRAGIAAVLAQLAEDRDRVSRVMLGTTHATNAIVARRGLDRVALVRLGAPAATEWPPLTGWPTDLSTQVLAGAAMLGGGHMVDGTPISPLDRDGIRRFLDGLDGRFDSVAVCGIFAPSSPEQERDVEQLVHDHIGENVPVFLSQDIGPDGLLERENATVLNAALRGVASEVTRALVDVVAEEGLDVSTFFAQNDGTLMSLDYAVRYPVLTIGSGPANSLRGAAFLSGAQNAIVVDVGGTTSDLGVLVDGFPRESTLPRDIGGVRTNFRMPDILSLGIGGGTIIDPRTGAVGPGSVGYRIAEEGLLFGGSTPTLTDAAAAAGHGIRGRSLPPLSAGHRDMLARALAHAHERIEEAVERLSLGRVDLPLIVVGGGAQLVPDDLPGAGDVLRPDRADVANAVGAAISLAGGRADQISDAEDRDAAIAAASEAAIAKAIQAGADPLAVEIVDVLETSLSYTTRPTLKVSVKAAGPLSHLAAPIPAR